MYNGQDLLSVLGLVRFYAHGTIGVANHVDD